MIFNKIKRKIKDVLSLSGNGERVDINVNKNNDFEGLDIYQKSHVKRYEFAKKILNSEDVVADFACGTGYGTVMLSDNSKHVTGLDIDSKVIDAISKRYSHNKKVSFINSNILDISYQNQFDKIISFETLEHLEEEDIVNVLKLYFNALKYNGVLLFSVPYMQEDTTQAINMGFHKTFYINEEKIKNWLSKSGFMKADFKYQNYKTHSIEDILAEKDFIICEAYK